MDLHELERAVEQDPKDPIARLRLGGRLLDEGRAEEALDHLRRAMILKPDLGEAYLSLGQALLSLEEEVAALATLEGGREIARSAGRVDLVAEFDALLAGRGPVKRSGAGTIDEAAFTELARSTLASIAQRLSSLPAVALQRSPSVLVLEAAGARMGLSEQRSSREIWCTSGLGELRFRHIGASGRWRAGGGEDLVSVVGDFLSRQLGARVTLE
jgi:tetratricopeptide (TPR) repeat protein